MTEPRTLTRRQLLSLAVAGGCLVSLGGTAWARSADLLPAFLDLSRDLTGFDVLDQELGQRYLSALLASEPDLDKLLGRWVGGNRDGWSRPESALLDLVVECWYAGTVPTARGTQVVSYEGALGWACLPRRTPVTFCR